jgi:hypothetical protein
MQVFERSSGLCEGMVVPQCSGRCEQVHHLAGRGGPDPHRLANLIGLCAACHAWAHANPAAARDAGLMVSRHL